MTERENNPIGKFIAETESIRLTNLLFRIAWKTTALFFAITSRILTGFILIYARRAQRDRNNW
jgi:hypothetical protein